MAAPIIITPGEKTDLAEMNEDTGRCLLTMLHDEDTHGHAAVVEWTGDVVTITRITSGRSGATTTTKRDTLTVTALLTLIVVPDARPVPDFTLLGGATVDPTGRGACIRVESRNGQGTIGRPGTAEAQPAALPQWFLRLLHGLVLDDPDQ